MFEQARLGYDFAALEPHIDELTMQTHYGKHHAGYTNNLNKALEKLPELAGKSIEAILTNLEAIEDPALRTVVRNNGGGYYNHNLYFAILSPQGGQPPQGRLAEQINADFGSFQELVERLTATAASVFGSGWAWLSKDPSGKLVITSTPNQDNPLMTHGGQLIPLLGIDVWEHAYYLKYKNVRADYLQAFFKVLDWGEVARRYEQA
ncbi:MAG TPA: superoxide dismutase [Limnochordia bacterium]|nr:superoxide dismutase [Limnochordia bacterium]